MTQAFNLSQFANTIEDVTGKAVLTSGQSVTGILPVANGGSGVANVPSNRVMVGSGTSGFSTVGTTTSGGGAVSAGMLLTYQGAASNPTWESPPITGLNYAAFTTSGNWTVPAGVTKCIVGVAGGGGGANGFAGGLGGQVFAAVTGLTSGATIAITVGRGGDGDIGGSPYYNTAGGTSSFGSYVTCTGGSTPPTATTAGTFILGAGATRIRGWGDWGFGEIAYNAYTDRRTYNVDWNFRPGYNQQTVYTGDPKVILNAGTGGLVVIYY